ncbi:hypothetical protein C9439_04085 [archaeon SCG-AAA382B04]|nr:hypothetical protein C9439_04085 [archaeon SCG-AAA382B04]
MIVADTSALISLATVELLDIFLTEFDVHTTEQVIKELEDTSEYDDTHGKASKTVLDDLNQITVHQVKGKLESSRIDSGEGACALLTKEIGAKFLVTDDLRALPELQAVADPRVAISPIVLKALVKREVLEQKEALNKLNELAEQRNWLGAPIYRRARDLFE